LVLGTEELGPGWKLLRQEMQRLSWLQFVSRRASADDLDISLLVRQYKPAWLALMDGSINNAATTAQYLAGRGVTDVFVTSQYTFNIGELTAAGIRVWISAEDGTIIKRAGGV